MLHALIAILTFQLLGETAVRALALPLPGPVLGMMGLLAAMIGSARFAALIRPTAQGILAHLSLLFVPAGAGVVGHLATLGGQTGAILLAVVLSTVLAITVGALTFAAVARLTGSQDD
ncbi:CidA/LrgA family protein [Pseudotabrizicola algicola]|uniref:CidA/LrgA family protein n=1 Tax=Pseudotabrizicola algicola TaxID=2709381 RepID=A0A6B3RSB7_9RHOB|nr:CidA/LrgA family protein [Pseudotabrizicola algicola]NEX45962.1 CidA/LrgA family protein [Pseudotabrizicola algicola]